MNPYEAVCPICYRILGDRFVKVDLQVSEGENSGTANFEHEYFHKECLQNHMDELNSKNRKKVKKLIKLLK